MQQQIRASAIALLLLGSAGIAAAQTSPSRAPGAPLNLSPAQERTVMQGLKNESAQSSSAGAQTQMGTKLPDSVMTTPLPGTVTAEVPETKEYLFVKLPDRVLLIDPDTKMVAEIIMDNSTTGSSGTAPSSSGTNAPSAPAR